MPDTFSKNRAAHDALGCCGRCRRAQTVAMVCYGDRKPLKSSTIRLGVAAGAGITAPTVSQNRKKIQRADTESKNVPPYDRHVYKRQGKDV